MNANDFVAPDLRVTFAVREVPGDAGCERAAMSMLSAVSSELSIPHAWVGGPVPRNTPIPDWSNLLARGMQVVWLQAGSRSHPNKLMADGWQFWHRSYKPLLEKPLPQAAPWLCTVAMDVDLEHEEEFNAWYSEEHVNRIAAVPGVISASRFVTQGHPRYLALYHVDGPSTLMSPAYAKATETPWSFRVRRFMRDVARFVYRPARVLLE